uniref:Calcium voltage-gated channel auxiliary subunit alpha2delta 3 n=1 Tax=Sphenodon punctatus TaxID=8508 RepID=A0A8D0GQL3_SPHPU
MVRVSGKDALSCPLGLADWLGSSIGTQPRSPWHLPHSLPNPPESIASPGQCPMHVVWVVGEVTPLKSPSLFCLAWPPGASGGSPFWCSNGGSTPEMILPRSLIEQEWRQDGTLWDPTSEVTGGYTTYSSTCICVIVLHDFIFCIFQVRIFTYLIGREAAFADNLKWMACANKGFFTQISTLADVQENVMEYLHVLSRPKVIDQEHDVVWTEAYIDSTLPQAQKLADDQGLVLMTTVAMPVFSKQNETRSRGILLGVVGTDVPVKELLKTIPKYKLGIHGYAFAITNNGYILTHPELRPLYEEGKKRRKPNYSSVDLSEVEWEDRDDVLRNAMVNRKTGKFSMEVKKTVDKGKRVLVMTNDYYYTDIKGTPFSLGVTLSRGHGKYFFRGNVTIEEGLHDIEQPDVSLADEWSYCNTDLHPEHRQMTQLQAIKSYLTGKEPLLQCEYIVSRNPLHAQWESLAHLGWGVEVAFLGTRTGLSRINLFVGLEQLTNQDFLTAEDKENIFNADHFPLWYRRAAEQIPGNFVYSIPFSTVQYSTVADYSNNLQITNTVGIQMKLDFFQRKFWTAITLCHVLEYASLNCTHTVMSKLLTMDSFKRITLYDYQAMCRTNKESSDSAHSLLDPYNAFFAAVKWIMTELVLFLVEFNLCSWWHSDLTAKAQRLKQTLEPCDTEYPAFVSERTIKETMGNIDCDDCFKIGEEAGLCGAMCGCSAPLPVFHQPPTLGEMGGCSSQSGPRQESDRPCLICAGLIAEENWGGGGAVRCDVRLLSPTPRVPPAAHSWGDGRVQQPIRSPCPILYHGLDHGQKQGEVTGVTFAPFLIMVQLTTVLEVRPASPPELWLPLNPARNSPW